MGEQECRANHLIFISFHSVADKQDGMMAVVMPLLIAVLDESSMNEFVMGLHNTALDALNKVCRGVGLVVLS